MTRLQTPQLAYIFNYPVAAEFARQQREIFWLPDEIKVEKDVHDIKTNFTPSERHGVTTVLKLFTLYEVLAGNEYWGNKVMRAFPRPDIQMMASCFSFFELNIHGPFYNRLNEALHLNTEEFYLSYLDDTWLKARMESINDILDSEDLPLSLAAFSLLEGMVLYSSFAFLKHFQSQGKNKLLNVVRGINFSVRDENLHHLAGAWLFKTLCQELGVTPNTYKDHVYEVMYLLVEQEDRIVDMIFSEGPIEGIKSEDLKVFVRSRADVCLENLGLPRHYNPTENPIKDWFYSGINGYQLHDFFTGLGSEYNRAWDETAFAWRQE
jgi:ribonucleoside-diphosphate reductase beta chain